MSKIINEDYRAKLAKAISKRYKIWYGASTGDRRIDKTCRDFTYIERASEVNPETMITTADVCWLARQIQMGVAADKIISDKRWTRFEIGRVYLTRWDCSIEPEGVRRAG